MLKSMLVKNFAIIDNIEVDFSNNMTVLTGETGAGKSLIIDAIGLLFGDRASSEMVRHGENKAIIEGVFDNSSEEINNLLSSFNIDIDDFLVIRREIYENGKSICKVNGNTVNLNFLQEISIYLGNIHTQFDNEKLVNPKNYLSFIDDDENKKLLLDYEEKLKIYNKINKRYTELIKSEDENNQKLDFYKFQYNELKKANLNSSEEEELKNRLLIMNNHEKITSSINEFLDLYNANDLLDKIYESINILEKLSKFDEKYHDYKKTIEENYYSINDVLEEINLNFKNQDFDFDELNEINDRLGVYSDYKRKYKMTTDEIVEYFQNIANEIEKIENFDTLSVQLEKEVAMAYNDVIKIAECLSERRKTIAKNLVEEIRSNLIDLQLENTILDIVISTDKTKLQKTGIDDIDILITFNKGEPLKPLSKVASGGELSRFMLALKTIASNKFNNQTLVFDEIDNGVSGGVAYSIANKIKEISKHCQVLCVTHLVQVAAKADHQLFLSKSIDESGRTSTRIKELNYDERVEEISKMASFGNSSEASINLAKELLKN